VPQEGRRFPTSSTDWQWWRKSIPSKLKELYDQQYSIVFLTNQNLTSARLKTWIEKVPLIAEAMPEVPFRLLAATASDVYRKPLPGMWWELEKIYAEGSSTIDKDQSFFVGDAAGRPNDHSAADRKLALNIGIPFYTPEEYFLTLPSAPYNLTGFDARACLLSSRKATSELDTSEEHGNGPLNVLEIVIFVGCPGLGKTSYYRKHFSHYAHVNQDTLKRREKCLALVEECVKSGRPCVVDNTNRDRETRKLYIEIARRCKVPVRCFVFRGGVELAWHNVVYRTWCQRSRTQQEPPRPLVPRGVLLSFQKQYEEPLGDEGFDNIKIIDWSFQGSEEEETRWCMWLDL